MKPALRIRLILVPYDSGQRGLRMGAGPEHLLRAGLRDALIREGHEVHTEVVEARRTWHAEIATTFALAADVADRTREAHERGWFPILVTGNCMMSLGAVAALKMPTSVVWLDAHGDFNTPETTASGFIDGMALATMTGRCWREMASAIPGFRPLDERRVVLAGARDLDPWEAKALDSTPVTRVDAQSISAKLEAAAATSSSGAADTHLHVDLDVLDTSEGHANEFAVPGGVNRIDLLAALEATSRRVPVASATLSAYDPHFDADGRVARVAAEITTAILRGVGRRVTPTRELA
jgi:arginase